MKTAFTSHDTSLQYKKIQCIAFGKSMRPANINFGEFALMQDVFNRDTNRLSVSNLKDIDTPFELKHNSPPITIRDWIMYQTTADNDQLFLMIEPMQVKRRYLFGFHNNDYSQASSFINQLHTIHPFKITTLTRTKESNATDREENAHTRFNFYSGSAINLKAECFSGKAKKYGQTPAWDNPLNTSFVHKSSSKKRSSNSTWTKNTQTKKQLQQPHIDNQNDEEKITHFNLDSGKGQQTFFNFSTQY